MSAETRMVRTRIAPSPTGDPHVGTAYVALFNWMWAKKHGGQFLLRIEDTDQVRSTAESEAAIMRSLRWIGLPWDEGPDIGGPVGPYRQSERTEIYQRHAAQLLETGGAYRCFCTAERLEGVRAAQLAAKTHMKYDGHCRRLPAAEVASRVASGEPHVVRMAFPETGITIVPDQLRGGIEFQNEQIDDQVLQKSDGYPTYHLANVVDDHLMGITDVIRAEEWISSTPKHVRLYEAFGWTCPKFFHLPLLRNADRSKISKRKNPVSLDYYERIGILPEAMRNFLGLLGYSMPNDQEIFDLDEMLQGFDFGRLNLGGPVFDRAKLDWLNGQYIRKMGPAALAERVAATFLTPERLAAIAPLALERVDRLDQFVPLLTYLLGGKLEYTHELLLKLTGRKGAFEWLPGEEATELLRRTAETLDTVRPWSAHTIEATVTALCEQTGWKKGRVLSPVRAAVSARPATPPLFELLEALGGAVTRARLRDAADWIDANPRIE